MVTSTAKNTQTASRVSGKRNITITDVFRNLSDEKCVELRTEEGVVFYYQSVFDHESGATFDTVRSSGRTPQVSKNLELGNNTASAMETLFSMLPSNIAKPVFL